MIFGTLTIQIHGKNATRFLSLCVKRNIPLWNIEYFDDYTYQFGIYLDDYLLVKPICRKTHTHLKLVHKMGGPVFYMKYHMRIVFLIAFVFTVIAVSSLTNYIWKVDICGNSFITNEKLYAYLKEEGYGYGSKKNNLDLKELNLKLRKDFDEIIWATSYIEGTKLVINLQENLVDPRTNIVPTHGVWNLVADTTGTVTSIITRNGTANVKRGDEFFKGDILVSGREPIINDLGEITDYIYLPADADIYANICIDYEEQIPCLYEKKIPTERVKNIYYIRLGEYVLKFPFWNDSFKEQEQLKEEKQFHCRDQLFFPVFLGKIKCTEIQTNYVQLDYAQAQEIAQERLSDFIANLEENGVSIIRKNVIMIKDDQFYEVKGSIYTSRRVGYYEHE